MQFILIRDWMVLAGILGVIALGYFTRWWVPVVLMIGYLCWFLPQIRCLSIGRGEARGPSDLK